MSLPAAPTNYAAEVDIQNVVLTWVNGDGAVKVIHEYAAVSGPDTSWHFQEDSDVPVTTIEKSLPAPDTQYNLRAKSRNADGDSAYTPVIQVTTGNYN